MLHQDERHRQLERRNWLIQNSISIATTSVAVLAVVFAARSWKEAQLQFQSMQDDRIGWIAPSATQLVSLTRDLGGTGSVSLRIVFHNVGRAPSQIFRFAGTFDFLPSSTSIVQSPMTQKKLMEQLEKPELSPKICYRRTPHITVDDNVLTVWPSDTDNHEDVDFSGVTSALISQADAGLVMF